MTKSDEPAMPAQNPVYDSEGNQLYTMAYPGMTKREYFASMIMQGMIHDVVPSTCDFQFCAQASVDAADALINELNKAKAEK